jgi:hypothetical protein
VLPIYDQAGIDFDYWTRCRRERAVYFLSRAKENQVLAWVASTAWDRTDPRNGGVMEDMRVKTRQGHALRLICYVDSLTGKVYEFLTNEPDSPPGMLVELYRWRWDIEKVFDVLKNKWGETKAWGTSLGSRTTQAQFLMLTHNRLRLYEQALEARHSVANHGEDRHWQQRLKSRMAAVAKAGKSLSTLRRQAGRATQYRVKFLRCLRAAIRNQLAEATAGLRLKTLYATL